MDWPEIIALRKFYSSRLGGISQHYLNQALATWSEKLSGHNVLGLGYAIPHLGPFFSNKNHVVAVTAAEEGALHWPYQAPCLSAVAEGVELPFADGSMDLVIMVHMLEYSESPSLLMQEIWRVLSPSGQLIVVVPNRKGLWAHIDSTPFGSGQPYSIRQLSQLFEEALFTPMHHETLLFFPPSERFFSRPHRLLEWFGRRVLPAFGGVVLASAKKQIYALHKKESATDSKKRVFTPAMGSAMNRH